MAEHPLLPADQSDDSVASDRLDSWKEIAAYLRRDVTTVRRWEKREGLPVQRHLHERRESVYAFKREIDAWWEGRRNHLGEDAVRPGAGNGDGEGTLAADTAPDARPAPSARLAWTLAVTFSAATLILAALLAAAYRGGPAAEARDIRFTVAPPEGTSFTGLSVSPDGRMLAFTAAPADGSGATSQLWIRSLDALEARPLPDTEDAAFPFWSPNGDALGFFAAGKLWIVPLSGGGPRVIADAPHGRGGTWNSDGVILFARDRESGISRVAASGGPVTAATAIDRPNERAHVWPEFLPDGRHFLYLADSVAPEHHALVVGTLDTSERRVLVPRAQSSAVYGGGFVFFARDRELVAQRFDLAQLALAGPVLSLEDRVEQPLGFIHKTDVSAAAGGVLVYRRRQSSATRLVWRDRSGAETRWIDAPEDYYEPILSPDETRVAVAIFSPHPSARYGYGPAFVRSDMWLVDRLTGLTSQFTVDPGADWGAVWSPDGQRLVYSSNRTGRLELYETSVGRADAEPVLLPSRGRNPVAQSWSPDGAFLLFASFEPETRGDLWLLPMRGDRTPTPLLVGKGFSEMQGQIAPDGRWFAYASDESGRSEVYVQPFPPDGSKWRVSSDGGGDPRWRKDGRELFYVAEDRRLMAVAVTIGPTFAHGNAAPLFDTGVYSYWYEARNLYDVTRDGRFLFMKPIEDDRSMPLTVIVHWHPRSTTND